MDRVFERDSIMSFAIEIVIKAPMDVVCDYIIEDEKIKEWNTFIIENRYPSNMDRENPRVAAVIKNEQREILFQYPGGEYWSLPAGAIELGETPEEAVVREVWEETGLKVQVKNKKGYLEEKSTVIHIRMAMK